jgi:hypothetical protein
MVIGCLVVSVMVPVFLLSVFTETRVFEATTVRSYYDSLSPQEKMLYDQEKTVKLDWLQEVTFLLTKISLWPLYLVVFVIIFPIVFFYFKRKSRGGRGRF